MPPQRNNGRMKGNWRTMHGNKGCSTWAAPRLVVASDKANRADQGNTIKANEYLDDFEVLEAKIDKIVELIRDAKCCTAYTGAGLSRASGIADYATRAKNSLSSKGVPKLQSMWDAQPTYSHKVLAAMEKEGYLHYYVQQNHDGLPQKAGFPQEKINEIHGAWYDPSNPVVQFDEDLRVDLFSWMEKMERNTDLCLCLGTSLSGMNADRVAKIPAKRMMRNEKNILGTVIINLQQTELDSKTAIRVWATLDNVFKMIADKLELNMRKSYAPINPIRMKHKFTIPYDNQGKYDSNISTTWNLNTGQRIRICTPGSMNIDKTGVMAGRDEYGHYLVDLDEPEGPDRYRLGNWWPTLVMEGKVKYLPFVNLSGDTSPLIDLT